MNDHPSDQRIELGRVIGILEVVRSELSEVKTRLVFRLDNLEQRVEALEIGKAANGIYNEIVKKGVWAVLGIIGTLVAKKLFF